MNTTDDLSHRLGRYLNLRLSLGFQTQADSRPLRDFIRFVQERGHKGPLTAQIAVDWACCTDCGPAGQSYRLGLARRFLTYLRAAVPETEVPGEHLIAGARRSKPHIYSQADIQALMRAAQALGPRGSLRPYTFVTLIGLMGSCGLRPSEAIHLAIEDVFLDLDPPKIVIQNTKFRKSRLVPLHVTTAQALGSYARKRRHLGYDGYCSAFFVSERHTWLKYQSVAHTFVGLASRLGLRGHVGERKASLHGLRHTFAVERLALWYREGEDVQARVPELSVYLGHVSPENTYWYLTATPQLLCAAADRFEGYTQTGGAL